MYRLVDTGAWDDPWFSTLSPDGKLLFLYLLTNRRTNSVGAYEITVRQIAFETGMPGAVIERLLAEMRPKVQWWPDLDIVWLKNFYGRQNNWGKAEVNARKVTADLPSGVREAVCKEYPSLSLKEDAPSIPLPCPIDTPCINSNVTEQNLTVTEQDGGTTRADEPRRTPKRASAIESWEPTGSDREWAYDNGFTEADVNRQISMFHDYYQGNGKAMKDWPATFRNWMRRSRDDPRFAPARASPNHNNRATEQDFLDLMHEDANAPPGHTETVIDAAYTLSDRQALGTGGERHREGVVHDPG